MWKRLALANIGVWKYLRGHGRYRTKETGRRNCGFCRAPDDLGRDASSRVDPRAAGCGARRRRWEDLQAALRRSTSGPAPGVEADGAHGHLPRALGPAVADRMDSLEERRMSSTLTVALTLAKMNTRICPSFRGGTTASRSFTCLCHRRVQCRSQVFNFASASGGVS